MCSTLLRAAQRVAFLGCFSSFHARYIKWSVVRLEQENDSSLSLALSPTLAHLFGLFTYIDDHRRWFLHNFLFQIRKKWTQCESKSACMDIRHIYVKLVTIFSKAGSKKMTKPLSGSLVPQPLSLQTCFPFSVALAHQGKYL